MRALSLIVVGIALVGCKDPEAKQPAKQPPAPVPSAPAPVTAAPPTPSLPPSAEFDSEVEDRDWAVNTERAIAAAAPELSDIDCKQHQCRASITAGTEQELVAKAEKLNSDDGLRSTEARGVVLSAPETINGRLTMKLYIQYER